MRVSFRYREQDFPFKVGDYVTVVVDYLYVDDEEKHLWYHGIITSIENDDGLWVKLDDGEEELFAFMDLENIIDGNWIPWMDGKAERRLDELPPSYHINRIMKLKGMSQDDAIKLIIDRYAKRAADQIESAQDAADVIRNKYK